MKITRDMLAIIICFMFLGWNIFLDIRKRRISLIATGISILLWICLFLFDAVQTGQLLDRMAGMLPGIFLLLIGIISRGALGLGDGILVIPVGLYMGFFITVSMTLWAFLLAFLWSILLLCVGRKSKDDTIPFAPCMGLGLVMALII